MLSNGISMRPKASQLSLKVALIYVIVATGWILISDAFSAKFITDSNTIIWFDIAKDGLFAVLTAGLLHQLLQRAFLRWEEEANHREQAELAQRDSDEKYHRLFDVANDAILVVDTHTGALLEANPAAEKMYGYTRDELIRLKATDLSAEPEKTSNAIFAGDRHIPLRLHRRKDGAVFPVEISCNDFLFQSRKIHVAAMRDITERRQMEAVLQEQMVLEGQLAKIALTAPGVVYTFQLRPDGSSCFPYVNPAIEEFFGIPAAELKTEAAGLFARIHPDDVDGVRASIAESAHNHSIWWDEFRYNHKVKGELYLSGRAVPQKQADGSVLWHGFTMEVTESRRQQQALEKSHSLLVTALESTADGILIVDRWGKVTSFNQKFLELWQIPPELATSHDDQRLLQYVMDQLSDPAAFVKRVEELYHAPEEQSSEELQFKDGRVFERYSQPHYLRRTVVGRVWSFRDISQRKAAEAALQLSDFSINQASLPTFWIAADGRILRVNRATCEQLGYTEAEILQLAITDLDPDFPAEQWPKHWRELREQKRMCFETNHRRKDGHLVPVEVSLNWFEFGGQQYNFAYARNISERKSAEAELKRNHENYRLAINAASAVPYQKNLNSDTYEFIGEGILAMTGYSPSEIRAHHWVEMIQTTECLGEMAGLDYSEARQRSLAGEIKHWRADCLIRTRNGEIRWVSDSSVPILDAAGKHIGSLGILQDITERKRGEENYARLAIAVEQAAESIVITDTRGTIQYVNPAFEKVSGYASAEAVGKNSRILKSGKQDAEFYRSMWSVLTRGEVWSGRFINKHKNGSLFEEDLTITPIRNQAGKIINYVAVKRDVTREVQLETQFRQAQKMEAIGTLAGGIAHDFNNILAAMFGYGYLLKEDVAGNDVATESVMEILGAAGRAKDLVQQILTFSRQREQKRQVVHLNTVVKEAVKFLRASLPSGIKIQMDIAEETPAVLADPTQIYQVVLNLATNAFHAMEGRNGQLTICLDSFEPDAHFIQAHPQIRPLKYTRLLVADTGSGMDAPTLERIFEPFFTTKPIGKGTGLGLSVVHGIVQSHEGAITVDSEVGRGTEFQLYFPAQFEPAITEIAPISETPHGHGQHILVVDDERTLTNVFEKLLTRLNYQVTTSNNPREAIKLFRASPDKFDLVITDLTMPEVNGLELARQIHLARTRTPILLVSGFSATLNTSNLEESGIRAILEKPISSAGLTEAMGKIFNQSQPV
jgi:PAS domain S-box-containing protein